MWTIVRRTGALAAVLVLFQGGIARASTVEVKVPFPFLVRGQMLPAGRYRIERDASNVLLIRGENNHAAAVVLTMPATEHDPAGEKPALKFTRHETQYRLSTVWESDGEGRTVVGR